ncbi:MAG: spore coat associated protein CotJA [Clostridia bacterium]|nr:spore coat associated protein CotJA [Clostridia bacterium]
MTSGRQLAMVYSPIQCFRMLYKPEDALMRGTLFEELDKPLGEVLL